MNKDRLLAWHASLDQRRGDRAQLRRAATLAAVLTTSAFYRFVNEVTGGEYVGGEGQRDGLIALSAVAGTLATAELSPAGEAIETAIASRGERGMVVKEARFRRLIESSSAEMAYVQLRRTISLLSGHTLGPTAAGEIERWIRALQSPRIDRNKRPTDSIPVKWAISYYRIATADNKEQIKGDVER
ncbi:MAG: type I-E CRISPR-associated protein Cse2/CasB [Alkalispirochaeta sp.]